jgi:hypothetical protein
MERKMTVYTHFPDRPPATSLGSTIRPQLSAILDPIDWQAVSRQSLWTGFIIRAAMASLFGLTGLGAYLLNLG